MFGTFQMSFVVAEVSGEEFNETRWVFTSPGHRLDQMVGNITYKDAMPFLIPGQVGGLAVKRPDTVDDVSCVGVVRSSIIQVPRHFLGSSGVRCLHFVFRKKMGA